VRLLNKPLPFYLEGQSMQLNSSRSLTRLLKGLGANTFGQLATAMIQICCVPILIHFWGVEQYGEWIILTSMTVYFYLTDIGFSGAAASEMTLLVSNGNRKEALAVFQSTWLLLSGIAITLFLLLSLSIAWLPIADWLNFNSLSASQTSVIVVLMVLEVLIGQQAVLAVAGFQSEGNYARGIFLLNLSRLVAYTGLWIAVVLGANPVVGAGVLVCLQAIGTVGMGISLQRKSPWLTFGIAQADWKHIQRLAFPAVSFLAFPLGQSLSLQGTTLAIGAILGAEAVVIYSTLRTLSRLAWQVLNIITNTLKSELSIAFGQGDLVLARKLHRYSCQAAFWLSLLAVLGLAVFGEFIIRVWTNGQVRFDAILFYLMLAGIVANALWNTSQAVPLAINKPQQIAMYYFIGTSCALGVGIVWLIPWLKLNGAILSLLVIDVVMALTVIRQSMILLQDNFSRFALSILTPLPVMKLLFSGRTSG
jgi:O-antigen/teichoic acid export membrane protein